MKRRTMLVICFTAMAYAGSVVGWLAKGAGVETYWFAFGGVCVALFVGFAISVAVEAGE